MSSRSYDAMFEFVRGSAPPLDVAVSESDADIVSPGRGFMSAFDLTMQLQVGCPGGCLYCYVPAGFALTSATARGEEGQKWGYRIFDKRDAVPKLRRHLEAGRLADRTIYWSGVTDPYATSPETTRAVWQALGETDPSLQPRRLVVQSRFRPDRDVELMAAYAIGPQRADVGPPVVISYSIGTDIDDRIRCWERATPLLRHRMACVARLRAAGLVVVATLSPFSGFRDLSGTVRRLNDLGVAYVTVLFFKERTAWANTPKPFMNYLRGTHPEFLDPAWQEGQLDETRAVFGETRVLVGKAGFDSLAARTR